mgnify:CR=1 FL=1
MLGGNAVVQEERPWAALADEVGMGEDEILERVAAGRVHAVVGRTLDLADDVPGALEVPLALQSLTESLMAQKLLVNFSPAAPPG